MPLFAFALAAGQDVAQRGRIALSTFLQPSGSASLVSRDGLVNDGGGVVTVVSGTMNVSVSAFRGFVQSKSSGGGVYPVALLADQTVTLPNGGASATTYQIVAQVRDSSMDTSGVQLADLTYINPAAPPAWSYIPIRNIVVRAGLTAGTGGLLSSDLSTDMRRYCAAAGGITPVMSSSDRDLITIDGASVYRMDTKKIQVRRAGIWYNLPFVQDGVTTITPSAANTQTTKIVTFPVPFQSTPTSIQLTLATGLNTEGENQIWAGTANWSATQFQLNIRRDNTTPTDVSWTAFEN